MVTETYKANTQKVVNYSFITVCHNKCTGELWYVDLYRCPHGCEVYRAEEPNEANEATVYKLLVSQIKMSSSLYETLNSVWSIPQPCK